MKTLKSLSVLTAAVLSNSLSLNAASDAANKPNFVIIFCDDMGYGDLSCYGNPTIRTPNIDRMACEGMKLTQFYVGAGVSTPSRAALMTGRLPVRNGLYGDRVAVLFPNSKAGLGQDEVTIAKVLQQSGYATGCVGKWHLATKTGNLNQIIVPKGKRANIIFSDGTQIYVNADTRVIYPAVFAKDKREILVTGEAYLDVTPDSSRPFIVKTNAFNVKVLGTQFNVCVYGDEPKASVVLVEGRVEVENDKHVKEVLAPNQMIELGNKGVSIKEVDVFEYICWKDNLMQVNDRKVGDVLNKLARYYGVFDKEIAEIPLSGKLDLRGSLEDVVEIICQSLFLRQETDKENNIIILK